MLGIGSGRLLLSFRSLYKDTVKEKRMNRWVFGFALLTDKFCRDMENVIRAVGFIIEYEKRTPAPLKRGVRNK
jgi:hypothetical protein